MSRALKIYLGVVLAALALLCLYPTEEAVAGATLHNIRVGDHPDHMRLVFDTEGAFPLRVGPASSDGITIEYRDLNVLVQLQDLFTNSEGMVSKAFSRTKEKSSEIVFSFRRPNTQVKSFFLEADPPKKGFYRLVIDLYPPGASIESIASANMDPQGTLSDKELPAETENPYETADRIFEENRDKLKERALEITAAYKRALDAEPKAQQVPLALYRLGLVQLVLGKPNTAETYLKRLVSEYPHHTLIGKSWIALGKAYEDRKVYEDALQAFQSAVSSSVAEADKTEALYEQGKILSMIGKHQQAVEPLKQCLKMDPRYYIKYPDILKFIGESYFGLKDYDKSREYLFWYLNLKPDEAEANLVLARIAETYLQEGQKEFSDKLFWYIEDQYPDSEGDYIAKIRRAEFLEDGKAPEFKKEAGSIYSELSEKDLSNPLLRLVEFKMARWEWEQGNYEKSLSLVNRCIQIQKDSGSTDELFALKDKVILDWAQKAFAQNDYAKVLSLYEENPLSFDASSFDFTLRDGTQEMAQTTSVKALVAQCYEKSGFYPNALAVYEEILAGDAQNDLLRFKAALCAYKTGDLEKSLRYTDALSSSPLKGLKNEQMGRIFFEQKNYARALDFFRPRVQAFKPSEDLSLTDCLLPFSESLLRVGQIDEALFWFEAILERLPQEDSENRFHVQFLSAEAQRKLEHYEEALVLLEKAVSEAPSEDLKNQAIYELSKTYLESGQSDKAVEILSPLLKSPDVLWQTAARQQLDYLAMKKTLSPKPL